MSTSAKAKFKVCVVHSTTNKKKQEKTRRLLYPLRDNNIDGVFEVIIVGYVVGPRRRRRTVPRQLT
jgi:hypothetical protein